MGYEEVWYLLLYCKVQDRRFLYWLEILSIKDKESKEFLIKINSFLLGKLQKEVYAKQLILLVNKILEGS